MNGDFFHRADAPFGSEVWQRIDEAVVGAATSQLSARRVLEIDGPYGLGLKSLPGTDQPTAGEAAGIRSAAAVPVATIQANFSLPVRDIANFEQTHLPFDIAVAAQAAIDCARQEDRLVFNGSESLGVRGLLNADGALSTGLAPWKQPGDAFTNVVEAVNLLDDAGLHGPYALALTPKLFNLVHRRYPDGALTEIEHLRQLITGGVVKAPAIAAGGVVVAVGKQYASIVLGQDLATGYVGPTGAEYEFFVMESLALRIAQPRAVCVLTG